MSHESTGFSRDVVSSVVEHYERCLDTDGDQGQLVGWRDSPSQLRRFEVIHRLMGEATYASVCDFGCGLGEFRRFLRQNGSAATYIGVDASEQMIAQATEASTLDEGDGFHVGSSPMQADMVIASGIFNVRLEIDNRYWWNYLSSTVRSMWSSASIGVVFNVLSTESDVSKRKADLFYASPIEILSFCLGFSPDVRMAHHYGLFDMTFAIFKTDVGAN